MDTRQIYQLHLLDTTILEKDAALALVNRKLQDDSELNKARHSLQSDENKLMELVTRQRDADNLISDIQAKLIPLERKAYSGTITNTSELEGVYQDLHILKKNLDKAEDSSLSLMEQVDKSEQVVEKTRVHFSSIESQRTADINELNQQRAVIQTDLADLTTKRTKQAALVDKASTILYETLRASRTGSAVSVVERGMCRHCRISLPTSVIQKTRGTKEIVQCPNCEMILFGA